MRFCIDEARDWNRHEHVEIGSLDDLLLWIQSKGEGRVVITELGERHGFTLCEASDELVRWKLTVYNDYLE